MNRPIPAGDYVEHFDPELPHHRAWLQAVLEQLVGHDPQALEEGGTLRRLWTQHQEDTLAAATGSRYPNPLVGVPYFQKRDSAQRSQRDRSCFSSSCAMLLEALKPGTLPGSNGDDAYLAVVQRYGDTTDATAQLQALAYYGLTAQLGLIPIEWRPRSATAGRCGGDGLVPGTSWAPENSGSRCSCTRERKGAGSIGGSRRPRESPRLAHP